MALLVFLFILVVLVLVHELGHFAVAKFFGIKVEEFGVFFPPRIFAIKRGETEYSFNWLPFGGFVKIFGENGAESEKSFSTASGHNGNASENDFSVSDDERCRSFAHKPRLVQAAVLVAGIACNLVFAWLVLSVGYMVGLPASTQHKGFGTVQEVHTMIVNVFPGSPADLVGIKPGDVVTGAQTSSEALAVGVTADAIQQFIAQHSEKSIVLSVLQEKQENTFVAKPESGLVEGRKALGIELDDVGVLQLPPHVAFAQGALTFWQLTRSTAVGLIGFFTTIAQGTASFSQVAGPIGIAGLGATAVRDGFASVVVLTAIISINLALLNILPIPGLDGGRLFITAIEGMRRKALPQTLVNSLTLAGLALLILLMLVVSYHDVARLLHV